MFAQYIRTSLWMVVVVNRESPVRPLDYEQRFWVPSVYLWCGHWLCVVWRYLFTDKPEVDPN